MSIDVGPLRTSRGAWLVLGFATVGYLIAVMQRTNLGVVGLAATERFAVGAGIFSLFAVVQMLVYGLAQVPAGLASDRYGTRAVMAGGALLMATGQAILASTDQIGWAIFGRVLVALGDACTWTPLARLVPNWFPNRIVPIITQGAAMFAMGGQLLSAVPFVNLLRTQGWAQAFYSAAGLALFSAALLAIGLRNRPRDLPASGLGQLQRPWAQLRAVLALPGTRLGFWGHWLCSGLGLVFLLMWGYPYLEDGQGLSVGTIGTLFTIRWVASVISGLTLGYLTGRIPGQREWLILIAAATSILPWLAVSLFNGPAPLWLLAVLVAGLGLSDPGSGVAFDIARTANPEAHRGTALGVVVMGGFTSALLAVAVIGFTLDATGGGYRFVDFRLAMATQFIFVAISLVGYLMTLRSYRRD